MTSMTTPKSALASAVALAIGVSAAPQPALADITLTFQNNATPSAPPLPFSVGASATIPFDTNTEFRVMTSYGSGTNNGMKDSFFGGEIWTFNNAGQMISTANTDANPGGGAEAAVLTTGVAGFPVCTVASSCPTLQKGASFLQASNFFNFMAPVVGSVPGNTYGVATIDVDFGSNVMTVNLPVAHAQWATGSYIIGGDPNANPIHGDKCQANGPCGGPGVDITGAIAVTSGAGAAAITFDYRVFGESKMTKDEVSVLGFNNQTVQWEVPGSGSIDNQNPVANNDGSAGSPLPAVSATPTNINVLANDTDPDWALLNSQAFDNLEVASAGPCANGGTLTDNNTNVTYQSAVAYSGPDSCSYTITDGRTGVSNTATVFLNVVSAGGNAPTAFDDGPGNTPGGPYATNQGVAVSFDVLSNDSEIDGDALTVTRVDATSANGGTVSIINGGAEGGNNVLYTPASGFNGNDTFTYDVSDVDGTDTATVTVQVVAFAESSAGTVTVSQRVTAASIGVDDTATESSCDGGCFNIEVQGVPSGGQVEVLLPKLSTGFIAGSQFRHFVTSTGTWKDHEAPDTVETAPADSGTGLCPGISSGSWRTPTAGDTCVKYSITDENGTGVGPNDDNPAGTVILDPVGFGQTAAAAVKQKNEISSSGCTLNSSAGGSWRDAGHWLLVGALLAFMRRFSRRKSNL